MAILWKLWPNWGLAFQMKDLVLKRYPICTEKHMQSATQLAVSRLMIRWMLLLIPSRVAHELNGHEKDPSQAIVRIFSQTCTTSTRPEPPHTYVDRVKHNIKDSVKQEVRDIWNNHVKDLTVQSCFLDILHIQHRKNIVYNLYRGILQFCSKCQKRHST